MCGIVGKINLNSKAVPEKDIKVMADKIAHRGPDDEGIWVEENVGLGNRRLAIIDLSKKGHMPMAYDRKRLVITFNGEIYNFETERKRLERLGYRFKSKTDTEVVLALYQEYGVNCLKYLRGMFALAIYDRRDKTLFLARDRVGKKPLKYFFDEKVFIFASELKAILTQKEVKKEVDFEAIHEYLTYGYVPAPKTGFKNIYKLEPGHYLWLDLEKRSLEKRRFWKLDFSNKLELATEEWQEKILRTLEESTRMRMMADVPVGAFLSGGVDSSAVVAMMSKVAKQPVKTFAIGYKNSRVDETPFARIVAERFQTDHIELYVEPMEAELLPWLAYQYEEPFADSSILVTYLVSKLAREKVTVILNGDGGDENFAGYGRYNKWKWFTWFQEQVWLNNPLVHRSLDELDRLVKHKLTKRIKQFSDRLKENPVQRFIFWNSYFGEEEKKEIYKNDKLRRLLGQDAREFYINRFGETGSRNLRDQALYADISSYLPEDLLIKVDIASMAVGLEGRSPFLDHKMLELCAKMPFELKVKGFGGHKYVLKKALEGILPEEILQRPKMGFSLPLRDWFKGKLNSYTKSRLLKEKAVVRNWFEEDEIKRMLKEHDGEGKDFGPRLWSLLMLELWWEAYFT